MLLSFHFNLGRLTVGREGLWQEQIALCSIGKRKTLKNDKLEGFVIRFKQMLNQFWVTCNMYKTTW
jgi:hypothetical protein